MSEPSLARTASQASRFLRCREFAGDHPHPSIRSSAGERAELDAIRPLRGHDVRRFDCERLRTELRILSCLADQALDAARVLGQMEPTYPGIAGGPLDRARGIHARMQSALEQATHLVGLLERWS